MFALEFLEDRDMKVEDIADALHMASKGIDTASESVDTAVNVKKRSSNVIKNLIEGQNYSKTEKYKKELAEAKRIDKKGDRMMYFFIVLWLIMIGATIIMCIMGNDVLLRVLHI